MKNTIIITVILVALMTGAKAQTIDTSFTSAHKMVSAQINPVRDNYFATDSIKYVSIGSYTTDALTFFSFNWTGFDNTGKAIRNRVEILNGTPFLTLKAAIQSANNLIPVLTWIGVTYNLTFK